MGCTSSKSFHAGRVRRSTASSGAGLFAGAAPFSAVPNVRGDDCVPPAPGAEDASSSLNGGGHAAGFALRGGGVSGGGAGGGEDAALRRRLRIHGWLLETALAAREDVAVAEGRRRGPVPPPPLTAPPPVVCERPLPSTPPPVVVVPVGASESPVSATPERRCCVPHATHRRDESSSSMVSGAGLTPSAGCSSADAADVLCCLWAPPVPRSLLGTAAGPALGPGALWPATESECEYPSSPRSGGSSADDGGGSDFGDATPSPRFSGVGARTAVAAV